MTEEHINKTADSARLAIAVLSDAAKREERVDGQNVHYWSEVAKHSMARNDTLISQLKEKEKIAADLEQQLNSVDIAAKVTHDLKAELERVHAAAAEWERRAMAAQSRALQFEERVDTLQAELDAVKARYKEDEDIYIRTRESNNRLRDQITSLEQQIDFLQDENQRQAEASAPVDGKTYIAVERTAEGTVRRTMPKFDFFRWVGEQGASGSLQSFTDAGDRVVATAYL